MNDDERPDALDAVDDLDVGPAPVGDLLRAGHTAKRRRRTMIASVAAVAVVLVGGGLVSTQVLGDDSNSNTLVTDNDPDPVTPDATHDVRISESRDPDDRFTYFEGAVHEISLLREDAAGFRSEISPWPRQWTDVPAGDYVIRAAVRPCEGSCDYPGSPTDSCVQAITVETELMVSVEFTHGEPCTIAVTPDDGADPAAQLPLSYRFVLTSSCGERGLLGRYRVVVRDGTVEEAEPIGAPRSMYRPEVDEVPTLEGLLAKADEAGPQAVVDLQVDAEGIPTSLSIDHLPNAIDDEECYDVSALEILDAETTTVEPDNFTSLCPSGMSSGADIHFVAPRNAEDAQDWPRTPEDAAQSTLDSIFFAGRDAAVLGEAEPVARPGSRPGAKPYALRFDLVEAGTVVGRMTVEEIGFGAHATTSYERCA